MKNQILLKNTKLVFFLIAIVISYPMVFGININLKSPLSNETYYSNEDITLTYELNTIYQSTVQTSNVTDFNSSKNLVSFWKFDKNNSTHVIDSFGNNDGTVSGATWNETGKYGGAYDFDGDSDYIQVPDNSSLNISDGLILSAWVNVKNFGSGGEVIRKGDSYIMRVNSAGTTLFYLNGVSDTSLTGTVIPNNTWVHLGMVYNTTHKIIYVNGTQDAIEVTTGSITKDSKNLRFGLDMGTTYDFNGTIDEVRIFNKALNNNDVSKLYQLSNPYNVNNATEVSQNIGIFDSGLHNLTIEYRDFDSVDYITYSSKSNFTVIDIIQNITTCRALNDTNVVYQLTANISNYGSGDCFPVSANNITLECFGNTIDGTGSNDAIDLSGSDNFTVRNCNITDWGVGIRGDGASDFYSLNNEINDMANYGIYLNNANNPIIENTNIWNVTGTFSVAGIKLDTLNNPTITNCEIWNTPIGLHIGGGQAGIIEHSTIRDNIDDGFYLYQTTSPFLINNCSVSGNTNAGIHLFGNTNVTFSVIQDNGIGFEFGAGAGCKIYNNLLNNTENYQFFSSQVHTWNITEQAGTRIYSNGDNIGGNYYTHSNSSGYSDVCVDSNTDGFCDSVFALNDYNNDYLPYSDEFSVPTTTTTSTTTTTTTSTTIPLTFGEIKGWFCSDDELYLIENVTTWNGTDYLSAYNSTVCEYNCSETIWGTKCNDSPFMGYLTLIVIFVGSLIIIWLLYWLISKLWG